MPQTNNMTPWGKYQADLQQVGFAHDLAQENAYTMN